MRATRRFGSGAVFAAAALSHSRCASRYRPFHWSASPSRECDDQRDVAVRARPRGLQRAAQPATHGSGHARAAHTTTPPQGAPLPRADRRARRPPRLPSSARAPPQANRRVSQPGPRSDVVLVGRSPQSSCAGHASNCRGVRFGKSRVFPRFRTVRNARSVVDAAAGGCGTFETKREAQRALRATARSREAETDDEGGGR